MKMNKKGFTLIEMLVVIAIIAVLVTIIVPTVSSATEKAKEAADAANIRAAISQVSTEGLSTNSATPVTVKLQQSGAFDANTDLAAAGNIAGYPLTQFASKSQVVVSWNATSGKVELAIS